MRIRKESLWLLLSLSSITNGFVAIPSSPSRQASSSASSSNILGAVAKDNNNDNDSTHWLTSISDEIRTTSLVMAMGFAVWASPAIMAPYDSSSPAIVQAVEKASGSGSRVNKDAESLLRYGLPINNKEVRQLQTTIETLQTDLQSKRKLAAMDGVKKTRSQMTKTTKAMTSACRVPSDCAQILKEMDAEIDPLVTNVQATIDAFNGSEQERAALDKAYAGQENLANSLTKLEEAMVPAKYVPKVPAEYADLPQLQGRATVEFTFEKPNKEVFNINGVNFNNAKMTMVIDGYAAPVTSGNFVELVEKGFYTNMKIQRSDGFVVQTGDPDGPAVGYVAPPSKSVGKGKNGERLLPLEITLTKDYPAKPALYEVTMDEEGRGGEATVLPFSSFGAMGWAREEYSPNTGSSQFFWLLFDSDLTPAGKNLLDGSYPCFGYVTKGANFLIDIKEGDIITSAKVTQGVENLKLPAVAAPAPRET